jgi:hypothetical protein
MAEFVEPDQLICPTGKSVGLSVHRPVQPLLQKYSDFPKTQISLYPPPSCPKRGALRNVINAGRDAVDAGGAFDERR